MSTYSSSVFNFSRSLPAPFDTLTIKKIACSSCYGDGTTATLNCTVMKAVLQVCGQFASKHPGGVGSQDQYGIAEYKSSNSPEEYHLAIYDSSTGSILASVYNTATGLNESYTAGPKGRDCAAVITAMFPALLKDAEFRKYFFKIYDDYKESFPDIAASTKSMAILCDNVYRRVMDESCPMHLPLNIDKSGNIYRVSQTHIESGKYIPKDIFSGYFQIFTDNPGSSVMKGPSEEISHTDFVGKYCFSTRDFSILEKSLIPELPEWYVIPPEVVDICKHAQMTSGKPSQMRNFLLRGPAGTGKTMGARAIAAGLGLPYVKYTCSANSEIFDFIGSVIPKFGKNQSDGISDVESYESLATALGLPGVDDMDYDPAGVFERITGSKKNDATSQDCMTALLDIVVRESMKVKPQPEAASYEYQETDFIKALRNGYVIELQEPTTIMQPGVLVGLNSLLEQEGSITLPTGEVIRRHPDAVVVVTTNVSYEGCRTLNQSVLDRMSLVRDVELPSVEVMTERAMHVTGADDENLVEQMVRVVVSMEDYCRKNRIGDGCIGMRSLIDWINSTLVTDDPYRSALYTIVSKATADEQDREALITTCLETVFSRKTI